MQTVTWERILFSVCFVFGPVCAVLVFDQVEVLEAVSGEEKRNSNSSIGISRSSVPSSSSRYGSRGFQWEVPLGPKPTLDSRGLTDIPQSMVESDASNAGTMKKLRVICMSDTHGAHRSFDMPDGDILIHAGDFTDGRMPPNASEVQDFDNWLGELPYQAKIVVGGNHDAGTKVDFEEGTGGAAWTAMQHMKNAKYLEDNGTTLLDTDVKVWGTPWTIDDANMFTHKEDEEAYKQELEKVDEDTVVLITHQHPCHMKHDGGCSKSLTELIDSKRLSRLKLVIFGHSHSPGVNQTGSVVLLNAAVSDDFLREWRDDPTKPRLHPTVIEVAV